MLTSNPCIYYEALKEMLIFQLYLPVPKNCPKEIYDLMCECWQRNESDRPNFREIHLFLQRKNLGYIPNVDWHCMHITDYVCNLAALWGGIKLYLDVVWMTSSELLLFRFVKHKLKFASIITMVFLIAISVESYKLTFLHATIYPLYKFFHYDYKIISCSSPRVKNGTVSRTCTILNVLAVESEIM